ncbi:M48 family metallopeptidase [Endozoicomonas ascidiicola]|uniref:M48 family metallopeptidase n=1 Tax=Endozoicomonas ascidiicola TaxID=1698521 RepID=UPI00082CCC4C|nr:M48 family metallopeptidase [Endozoicomonas ascidiicola]
MGAAAKAATQYVVVFTGQFKEEVNRHHAIERFQKITNYSNEKLEKIFSGKPFPLKQSNDLASVKKLVTHLLSIGLICRVIPKSKTTKSVIKKTPKKEALSVNEVTQLFQGEIEPVKISPLYSLLLTVGAVLILLLPLLYLVITIGIALLTGYHASHNVDLLQSSGNGVASLFMYGSPIFIGSILVFFMLKPLLAPTYRREIEIKLDPKTHRRFFVFIEEVSRRTGSPMPVEVIADNEVNASASLIKGAFSKDLRLTVGMPLIYGMTAQQLV